MRNPIVVICNNLYSIVQIIVIGFVCCYIWNIFVRVLYPQEAFLEVKTFVLVSILVRVLLNFWDVYLYPAFIYIYNYYKIKFNLTFWNKPNKV